MGYGYDTAGRLNRFWLNPTLSSGVPQGSSDLTYAYLADSYGLIASLTSSVHSSTYGWSSERDILTFKNNKIGSTPISIFIGSINVLGQRKSVYNTGQEGSGAEIFWSYDSMGQVVASNYGAGNASNRAYQYDAIGNRLATETGSTTISDPPVSATTSYSAASNNEYIAIATNSPAYDDDGNAVSYPLPADVAANANMTWDAENRLVKVVMPDNSEVTYDYDFQGRRIAHSDSVRTTRYCYDGWNVLAKYHGTSFNTAYTWGLDVSGTLQGAGGVGGLLSVRWGTVTEIYATYDLNGNVSEYFIPNAGSATIVAHYEYDAFGNELIETGAFKDDFDYRFSTKPKNETTGLYYYGYRYYNPVTGRWPSRDPIEERGGINMYGFISNDSVGMVDLLGLAPPVLVWDVVVKGEVSEADIVVSHVKYMGSKENYDSGWSFESGLMTMNYIDCETRFTDVYYEVVGSCAQCWCRRAYDGKFNRNQEYVDYYHYFYSSRRILVEYLEVYYRRRIAISGISAEGLPGGEYAGATGGMLLSTGNSYAMSVGAAGIVYGSGSAFYNSYVASSAFEAIKDVLLRENVRLVDYTVDGSNYGEFNESRSVYSSKWKRLSQTQNRELVHVGQCGVFGSPTEGVSSTTASGVFPGSPPY